MSISLFANHDELSQTTIRKKAEAPASSVHLRALRRSVRRHERYAPPFTDRSVVNLSLNEHPAPPPRQLVELLQHIDPQSLVTYDTEAMDRLRRKVAEREGVGPENVLLSAGSSQGIALVFDCLCDEPVLLPSICWSYYASLARLHGLSISQYAIDKDDGEFHLDLCSAARALEREEPSLAIFINPHMPTGALAPGEFILRSAELAKESLILVDEAYHGFSRAAPSLAARVLDHENLVVSKTFSKFFGLAGIRVGYLVASARLITELEKATPPFSLPYLSSALALAALEAEPYYRAQADELMRIKDEFVLGISKIEGVRPYASHGNFLLVDLESPEEAERARARIQGAGAAVRSARGYGLPSFLRIGLGARETMERVAVALDTSGGAA